MQHDVFRYLALDHKRLEGLLEKATLRRGIIDPVPYAEFRKGLLRHIGLEEKILFPALGQLSGGLSDAAAGKLRLDHGALVALLVPPPSPGIIATIRSVLDRHNALEEGKGGVYELAGHLTTDAAEAILRKMRELPDVPVVPHNPRPEVLVATRRAVERAGYVLQEP